MSTREIGELGERIAERYLISIGAEILGRNFTTRGGEIDLIARIGDELVFVEVKYRSNLSRGLPEEAVDERKRRRICKAALTYLAQRQLLDSRVRFDVISIFPPEIRHIPAAFEYIE